MNILNKSASLVPPPISTWTLYMYNKQQKNCERCKEKYLGNAKARYCIECKYQRQLEVERKYENKRTIDKRQEI